MGNQESSSSTLTAPTEPVSPHTEHYRELYNDLVRNEDDQKALRERFSLYFGGGCTEFGVALYGRLLGDGSVDEGRFVRALTELRAANNSSEHLITEQFYFSVFSHQQDTITKKELTVLLHVAARCALEVGTEHQEWAGLTQDHPLLLGLVQSAWVHAHNERLTCSQFTHWAISSCPGVFAGLRVWINTLLSKGPDGLEYQLPSLAAGDNGPLERQIDFSTLAWVLSTSIPMVYMGHQDQDQGSKDKEKVREPLGGEWAWLYSSDRHGLSMNRFQHHCSDYRNPSVLLLTCHCDHSQHQFIIALDTDWRDGTYYYGGKDAVFVQLKPIFRLMRRGTKLVSLNERQRGWPTGLRVVGSDGSLLLSVDAALNTASFLGGDKMAVQRVEVWGCGGVEAMESQHRMKEREKQQILLRQKVRREQLVETWDNSPDRYLLELGGVTTRRPTEQQQQ